MFITVFANSPGLFANTEVNIAMCINIASYQTVKKIRQTSSRRTNRGLKQLVNKKVSNKTFNLKCELQPHDRIEIRTNEILDKL